jgi:hypothetical protein
MTRKPLSRVRAIVISAVGWSLAFAAAPAGAQIPPAAIPPPAIEWVDQVLPAQSSIAPGDFAGVFSRVQLSARASEKEMSLALEALDAATTAEEAAGLLPESVAAEHPELVSFIETGVLAPPPPGQTVFTGEWIPPTPAAGGTLLPGFPPPYIIAMVELADEPDVRLITNVVDIAPADVHVGLEVEAFFEDWTDVSGDERTRVWLPLFRPVSLLGG